MYSHAQGRVVLVDGACGGGVKEDGYGARGCAIWMGYDIDIMQTQGAVAQETVHFGKFNIFLLTKSAQNAYGLKSGDYGRYRRYCGHKVVKLRQSLGIKHGNKTKFVKRDYLKEKPHDSKTLQLLLFNAEKNWAAANETKFSQQRKPSQKSRARFVSVKKLRRALWWTRQLRVLCGERTEQVTQLQAQAYELWLQGAVALEEGQWGRAQGRLIACRQILGDIGKASDSLSEKVFREKIDQVEQTIKFCNFKISKGKELSITQIVELRKGGDPALSQLIQSLTEQRLREVSLDHAGELFFGEERYPIRSQAIVQRKAAIEQSQANLEVIRQKWLANTEDDQLYEELLSLFSGLVLQTEEAVRLCDAEREDPKKREKYTQGELEILKKVSLLFEEMKMRVFIERNLVIFRHSTTGSNRGRKSSPQTIAKLLTATTSLFQELAEVVKQKGQISNSFEIEQVQAIDAKTFYLRTLRLLYVGQVYFNNGKLKEAHGLWGECQRCVRILTSKAEMNESRDDQRFIAALMPLPRILQQVRAAQCRSLIANFESEESRKDELGKRFNEIDIADQPDAHSHIPTATLDKLVEDGDAKLTLEQISQIPIIELPGKPQPIPTRPIFFDIYYNALVYPDLDRKAKPVQAEQKKSWWGRIFK